MLVVTRIYFEHRPFRRVGRELEALGDDIRRFFEDDDPSEPFGVEYRPLLDVIETADAIEIVADLPGVTKSSLKVVYTRGSLVVAGRKSPRACHHRDATFHLAERTFGRFACVVRLAAAVDGARARARLAAGQLHVVLPRLEDRRGRDVTIAIESAD